jgi:hypothetical protein
MLKQPLSFMGLFSGIKETFIAIGDSFKTGKTENTRTENTEINDNENKE